MTKGATAPHPGTLRLRSDVSVGDGLQEILGAALSALHRHNITAADPSAEAVHRFRVSVRRLRSVLSAFNDALPDLERRALSDRLRALAQRYGRAREWDVFIDHTLSSLRQAETKKSDWLAIEQRAREARQHALPPHETLRGTTGAVEAAIAEASWLRYPPSALAATWEKPLHDHATTLLAKRHRRLRKRIKDIDLTDQAAFHRLRVRVKKLRYPSELLKPLFEKKRANEYLEHLVAVQDVLGGMNDALVARNLVAELSPPPTLDRIVNEWVETELQAYRSRFPACRRAFRNAEPFWEQ